MATQYVRCPCRGNPDCKLCGGKKFYGYEPGPRGWMPFVCPTCAGARTLASENGPSTACVTCRGAGSIDPANPPAAEGTRGWIRKSWRFLFGG